MSNSFTPANPQPSSNRQTIERNSGRERRVQDSQPDRSSVLLGPLWEEGPQYWTDDDFTLNAEIQYLIDQASILRQGVDRCALEAAVRTAVENTPSLYKERPAVEITHMAFDETKVDSYFQHPNGESGYSVKNNRSLSGIRKCLEGNNKRLAIGRNTANFSGRRLDGSATEFLLSTWGRLEAAVDQQVKVCQHLSTVRDPVAISQLVNFAQIWSLKKWSAKVCDDYADGMAKLFNSMIQINAISESASSERSSEHPPSSTPIARENGRSARTVDVQPSTNTSNDLSTSQAEQASPGNHAEHVENVSAQTNDSSSLACPSALNSRHPSAPAMGEANSTKIIIRLHLPEDDKTAPRRMIWSQAMTRDEFFQQVAQRFREHSVQSVEAVLDVDKILVEPTGSEDEWEILQEDLLRMLRRSSNERLQVDAAVRVGSDTAIKTPSRPTKRMRSR